MPVVMTVNIVAAQQHGEVEVAGLGGFGYTRLNALVDDRIGVIDARQESLERLILRGAIDAVDV